MKRGNSKSPRSRSPKIDNPISKFPLSPTIPVIPPGLLDPPSFFLRIFHFWTYPFWGNGEFHNLFLAIAKSLWNIRPLFSRNDYNVCNFTRDVAKSFLKHSQRNIPRAKYLFRLSSDILWEMLPLPWEPPQNRIFLAEKLAFSPRFPNPARKVFTDCVFEWMLKQNARGGILQYVLVVQAFRKIRL